MHVANLTSLGAPFSPTIFVVLVMAQSQENYWHNEGFKTVIGTLQLRAQAMSSVWETLKAKAANRRTPRSRIASAIWFRNASWLVRACQRERASERKKERKKERERDRERHTHTVSHSHTHRNAGTLAASRVRTLLWWMQECWCHVPTRSGRDGQES